MFSKGPDCGIKEFYAMTKRRFGDFKGKSSVSTAEIEAFIDKVNNKDNGQIITVNGNRLEIRYDKASDQSWIDVSNDNEEGAIPRQQCSRVVPNEGRGYYMLEE